MVLDRGDGAGINPVDISVNRAFIELFGCFSLTFTWEASKQDLVLIIGPVGELVVADRGGFTGGVELFDEGIGSLEVRLARVECLDVTVVLSELGHEEHVGDVNIVDSDGGSDKSGESERLHIFVLNFYYYKIQMN